MNKLLTIFSDLLLLVYGSTDTRTYSVYMHIHIYMYTHFTLSKEITDEITVAGEEFPATTFRHMQIRVVTSGHPLTNALYLTDERGGVGE